MKETKKAFLRRLGRALFWRLPSGEAHAIVEDYSGFFDDRMTEGKTEAEVCREFGAPTEVAQAILRESGRRTQPLGLLIVAWVLLAGFLNWWWTWQTFQSSNAGYFWFYVVEFLLIPVLWLCWHGALDIRKDDLPHPWRWRIAAFGIPAAAWAAFYGYYAWCMLVFLPKFLVLPFEQQNAGAKIGVVIGTLKEEGSLLVLAVLAVLLVWAWREGNLRPLVGAAWCVGCLCSMSRLYAFSTQLDGTGIPLSPLAVLFPPLAVLLGVGLGGAVLTALLIRKGGRHGRPA